MREHHIPRNGMKEALFALVAALSAACATGLDPVRPGGGGAGTGAGTSSTTTSGAGAASSSTSSSTTTSSGGGSSTSSTSSTSTTSTSSTSTTSTSSTSTTSTSSGTVMGLSVEYLCAVTAATNQELKPHLQIVNNSGTAVPLSSLKIRYYFTKDTAPPTDLTCDCDYAMIGCGALSPAFSATTGMNADEYVEVSFQASAGSVAAGGSTGELQLRIHPTDYQYTFTQTNDYSFDPTKTAFAAWSHVTLYQGGTLVWGTEP